MKLLTEGHPALKTVCKPFDFAAPPEDPGQLARSMIDVMRRHRGLGLAAPQLGIDARLFVMRDLKGGWRACFNPEIVSASADIVFAEEGCLSFPHLWPRIGRPQEIIGAWTNEKGDRVTERLMGVAARCFAHEADHLDGITIADRAAPMALLLARKNAKVMAQQAAHAAHR